MANENDVLIIENGTVKKCKNFASNAVIPQGVTKISKLAFYDCRLLVSVVIPEGVTEIDG